MEPVHDIIFYGFYDVQILEEESHKYELWVRHNFEKKHNIGT